MQVLAVGLSHKTAPVEVRERFAFTADEMPQALSRLPERVGAGIILSTCNRTELYITSADHLSAEALVSLITTCKGLPMPYDASRFYVLRQRDAVRHLYRVAAGVDSMVLGEAQILGQVRDALSAAQKSKAVNPLLSRLFRSAISVGKRARSETSIGRYGVSVSSAAVALARDLFGTLAGRSVLVISAGQSGKLATRSLIDSGVSRVMVANRTLQRAEELAVRLNGQAIPFDGLGNALASADIVISSTGSDHFVLGLEDVRAAMTERQGNSLLLIDIAVPRDVDPRVREMGAVHLHDIDDLEKVSDANMRQRAREVHKVEAIVDDEVERFLAWWHSLDVVPTIVALHQRAEAIRRSEVERTLRRLPHLSPEEQRRVDAMASAIINKLLHHPTAQLKGNKGNPVYTEALRSLFDLDDT